LLPPLSVPTPMQQPQIEKPSNPEFDRKLQDLSRHMTKDYVLIANEYRNNLKYCDLNDEVS